MTKFEISYTQKDGKRIEGQIYTDTTAIGRRLAELTEWGCTNIVVKSIEE